MASRFWVGGTGTWDASDTTHWAASSNGAAGQSVPGVADTVVFDGSSGGGTVTVNTNFSITTFTTGAFTGTIDFSVNNNSPTMTAFSISGTGTRTLNMGSGTWTITGNNATIWNATTITNLTLVRGSPIVCNYSGATGTRTIVHTSINETVDPSFNITAGTDIVNINNSRALNVDFTGFSGSLSTGTFILWGSLTLSATMTVTATTNAISFAATSGTKTITSNAVTIDRPVTISGVGGTFQLADALLVGSTRILTVTSGVFNANNKNVTTGLFASNNSNIRSVLMGSGTWTLSGVGTVWTTATVTNLTFTGSASSIVISDISASSKTFTGGGLTFGNMSITGAGTGAVIFQNDNTWNNFTIGAPKTVTFTAGSTQTISAIFTATGTLGNVITINSSVGGTPATLTKSSSSVSGDYLSLQDSAATGGATWYAGANSTNVSGNTGWIFAAPPVTVVSAGGGNSKTASLSIGSIARI